MSLIKSYLDLSGGANVAASPLFMKDSECEIIQNYNLDTVGCLKKRPGIMYLIGQIVDNMSILNMFFFKNSNGTDYTNVLLAINAAGGATSVIKKISSNVWSNSKTGDTALAIPVFATFLDYVFRTNGSDAMGSSADLSSWGTTNCLATLIPKFCAIFGDRAYALNDNSATKYPSRIYWSSLPSGSPLAITWNAATQYADINPDDNDEITWGEPYGKVMLIFKTESVYRWIFGQTESDRVPGTQGTPQGLTVKQTQGMVFWTNKYGVWVLTNPYGTPRLISQKVQGFIDQIPTLSSMRAEVDNDHYKLYIGTVTVKGTTYTNCALVYTISKRTWHWETYPFPITAMARMKRATLGTTEIYDDIYLGDNDGFIYRTNTGSTDYLGTAAKPIDGKIQTKEFPMPKFPNDSILEYLWVLAQQAVGAKVNYRINRRDFNPWKDLKERTTESRISGKGKTIQFSITDNSINQSQIEGLIMQIEGEVK